MKKAVPVKINVQLNKQNEPTNQAQQKSEVKEHAALPAQAQQQTENPYKEQTESEKILAATRLKMQKTRE